MGDPTVITFFSIFGLVFNIVAYKRGALIGCSGLVLGAIGFVATVFNGWPLGLIILIVLGLMAFLPKKATAGAKVFGDQEEWQAERQASAAARNASWDAAPLGRNTVTARPGTNPLADLSVADYMGADFDADVHQIEEDFIAGRIDRATYVARRRALLN